MSLKGSSIKQIPDTTVWVAKAAFRKGNRYMLLRDTFGDLFLSEDFRGLFDNERRPAVDPARLALLWLCQNALAAPRDCVSDESPPGGRLAS